MATRVSTHIVPLLGALDLTSITKGAQFADLQAAEVDFTNYAAGGYKEFKTGIISGGMTVDLFQDYAAGVLDDSVTAGSSYAFSGVVPATPGTVAEGDIAFVASGSATQYSPRNGAVGDAAAAQITLPWSSRFAYGRVGHPSAARTANGNSTGIALAGPSASQYMVANLHVIAYSGFTSVAIKIVSDDSSGFSSATDRLTFTSVTAIGGEYKTAVGSSGWATETHHRVAWTVTGSGSITFAVTLGVV